MSFRDESGYTLPEVLVAIGIMVVITGATLAAMAVFQRTTRTNQLQNDSQQSVRKAMDQLSRELRNHSSATRELPVGIHVAGRYDLVFQTINPSRPAGSANARSLRRIRYCVDDPPDGTARLWAQTQDWTTASAPPMPSTAECPSSSWDTQRVLGQDITNRAGSQDRAAFCPEVPGMAGCDYSGSNLNDINRIHTTLYVDANLGEKPTESKLESGVMLRNRNRPPVAAFTWTTGAGRELLLNASDTYDPEGDRMTYVWFNGSAEIGRGLTADWTAPAPGPYTITLEAADRSGLVQRVQEAVVIP